MNGLLVFIEMKQKKIFSWKKNSKWPTQKNLIFQLRQFSIFFHENFMDWSLGYLLMQGHWCGSTYMVMRLSDISSKTGKKCMSRPFWFFLLHLNENKQPVHMRYHLFLQYEWFLQNLEKDFIRTNMHTTVSWVVKSLKLFTESYL